MRTSISASVAIATVAALVAACTGDEQLAPVVDGSGSGGATASSSSASSSAESVSSSGAGTPVREVLLRNPFGDQEGNLLSDGDFELSITGNPGQQGWNYFGPTNDGTLLAETGGLCRSGLRCGVLPRGGVLLARGTAAADQAPMTAEIWVKPQDGGATCPRVTVYVLGCDDFEPRGQLGGLASQMGDDGWCPVRGSAMPSTTGICLYVENDDVPLLIDQASLRATDADATRRIARPVVSATSRARMDAIRQHLKLLPIGPARGGGLDLDPRP